MPWRRALINNASSLRDPHANNFSLLLGFFPGSTIRTPAPFQPVLPDPKARGCCTFVPPPTSGITGANLLSSRDGFLLAKRRSSLDLIGIWNPIAGTCEFLPMPSFSCADYILLTHHDLSASSISNEQHLKVLAVRQVPKAIDVVGGRQSFCYRFCYQLFSAGAWGPVERSQELAEGISVHVEPGTEVVFRGGAVHWLASSHERMVALDVLTGRSWTTELPTCWRIAAGRHRLVLATSRDGRLSVMRLDQQQMQGWVLTGGDQWSLRRVVDMREIMLDGQNTAEGKVKVSVRVFCPRSGYVLVQVDREHVLVEVDTGSFRRIQGLFSDYEMDWSYWAMCLSEMKNF